MEQILQPTLDLWPLWALGLVIVACIVVLGWGAEWLVRESVALSERSGVPKVVVGATIVSLGTTAPEVAVSVMAAVKGIPDLAMGNAVGSIICDTGLVLGLSCLIRPLPLPRKIVNRQGWIQFAAGLLLVLASWPWSDPLSVFSGGGGHFSRTWGFVFLALLAGYLWLSTRWAKRTGEGDFPELERDVDAPLGLIVGKLLIAVALVVISSDILILAVTIAAKRLGVPTAIIAGTVVAFGTSTPELVTGITAARRGHGDLAIGNVVGADILNALFVVGASAAVTSQGLTVTPAFFMWLFPFMLGVLVMFRVGILISGPTLHRGVGALLLGLYVVYVITAATGNLAHQVGVVVR